MTFAFSFLFGSFGHATSPSHALKRQCNNNNSIPRNSCARATLASLHYCSFRHRYHIHTLLDTSPRPPFGPANCSARPCYRSHPRHLSWLHRNARRRFPRVLRSQKPRREATSWYWHRLRCATVDPPFRHLSRRDPCRRVARSVRRRYHEQRALAPSSTRPAGPIVSSLQVARPEEHLGKASVGLVSLPFNSLDCVPCAVHP